MLEDRLRRRYGQRIGSRRKAMYGGSQTSPLRRLARLGLAPIFQKNCKSGFIGAVCQEGYNPNFHISDSTAVQRRLERDEVNRPASSK